MPNGGNLATRQLKQRLTRGAKASAGRPLTSIIHHPFVPSSVPPPPPPNPPSDGPTVSSSEATKLEIAMVKRATYPSNADLTSVLQAEVSRAVKDSVVVRNGGTRYGNPEGLSILEEIRSLKAKLDQLQVDSKAVTVPIRVRFFRVFQRDRMKIPFVDVAPGNQAAHRGALKTDVRVFEQVVADLGDNDYRSFELIYGLSFENAKKYTDDPFACDVLDRIATQAACGQQSPIFDLLRRLFLGGLEERNQDTSHRTVGRVILGWDLPPVGGQRRKRNRKPKRRRRSDKRVVTSSSSSKIDHKSLSVDEIRDCMRRHFADAPEAERSRKWSQLWEDGFVPWDRGRPNPALDDALTDQAKLLGVPSSDEVGSRRKRALVPGCGKGYDVLLLASFGYDAYGLEVSPTAVEQCQEFARDHAGEYPPRNTERGPGRAVFIVGDFFEDGWFGEADGASGFDLIYDYTFSCIFPPALRSKWSLRHSQLLSKDSSSRLVCVEFPTTKSPSLKGPPFGVAPKVYLGHLNRPGVQLPYNDEDDLLEHEMGPPSQNGLVRVAHWQPERTHAIGKDTDWISIWKHA